MTAIPTIDLRPIFDGTAGERRALGEAIDAACRDTGFFMLTGHGVPGSLIDALYEQSRRFFASSAAAKAACAASSGSFLGYRGLATEPASTTAPNDPADLRERFAIGGARDMDKPAWPEALPDFRPVVVEYFGMLARLAEALVRAFALGLSLPPDYFDRSIDEPASYLVLLHYPGVRATPLPGQIRAGQHRDRACFTILSAGGPGLQVHRRDDRWQDVICPREVFVVNVGSMLERWTNRRWRSSLHRVENPPGGVAAWAGRQSVAFFFNPNPEAVLSPPPTCHDDGPGLDPAITVAEYLKTMLQLHSRR